MATPASAACLVELGHLNPPAHPIPVENPRGRLFYLATVEAVVTPLYRQTDGWWCSVIARSHPDHLRVHQGDLHLTDAEIAGAMTVIALEPDDADGMAMLWQVRIFQRWRGGHMMSLARLLTSRQLRTGTVVTITDPTARRLMHGVHLWAEGLRSLLRQLVHAGLLTPIQPRPAGAWGAYAITIPTPALATERQTP